ncbi:hypothetical protein D3C76_1287280 [compost metagenome]
MQAVLRQWRVDQLHTITHRLRFALQVVMGHVLILNRQVYPAGRQHPGSHGKTVHRHFQQKGIVVELGRVGIAANHCDGKGVEVGQRAVGKGVVLTLEQANPVQQVAGGELAKLRTLFVVPGIDQYVIATFANTQ